MAAADILNAAARDADDVGRQRYPRRAELADQATAERVEAKLDLILGALRTLSSRYSLDLNLG